MKTTRGYLIAGALALTPVSAIAMELRLPFAANLTSESNKDFASYSLPTGSWENGKIASVLTEGAILQQAWRVDASDLTTLQLLDALRLQLVETGYEIVFECDAPKCGGFDFRYETEIIPEPAMHVDLGDFRFLSAKLAGDGDPEYMSLMVSRSSTKGYIQVTHVGNASTALKPLTLSTKGVNVANVVDPGSLPDLLESTGSFVLDDLEFATGSSQLSGEDFASLAALSDYLKSNPERKIALVGHTDAEGSLNGNVALSKKRAASVAALLAKKHGVDKTQMSAEGMGFLAPRASNLTEEGRTNNRRVEVIITSTE